MLLDVMLVLPEYILWVVICNAIQGSNEAIAMHVYHHAVALPTLCVLCIVHLCDQYKP